MADRPHHGASVTLAMNDDVARVRREYVAGNLTLAEYRERLDGLLDAKAHERRLRRWARYIETITERR